MILNSTVLTHPDHPSDAPVDYDGCIVLKDPDCMIHSLIQPSLIMSHHHVMPCHATSYFLSVIRKTMSQPEALRVYIEMLARAHLEGGFVDQCADVASGRARGSTSGAHSSSSSSSSSSKSRFSQSSSSSSGGGGGGGGSQGDPCVSVEKAREYLAAARQVSTLSIHLFTYTINTHTYIYYQHTYSHTTSIHLII